MSTVGDPQAPFLPLAASTLQGVTSAIPVMSGSERNATPSPMGGSTSGTIIPSPLVVSGVRTLPVAPMGTIAAATVLSPSLATRAPATSSIPTIPSQSVGAGMYQTHGTPGGLTPFYNPQTAALLMKRATAPQPPHYLPTAVVPSPGRFVAAPYYQAIPGGGMYPARMAGVTGAGVMSYPFTTAPPPAPYFVQQAMAGHMMQTAGMAAPQMHFQSQPQQQQQHPGVATMTSKQHIGIRHEATRKKKKDTGKPLNSPNLLQFLSGTLLPSPGSLIRRGYLQTLCRRYAERHSESGNLILYGRAIKGAVAKITGVECKQRRHGSRGIVEWYYMDVKVNEDFLKESSFQLPTTLDCNPTGAAKRRQRQKAAAAALSPNSRNGSLSPSPDAGIMALSAAAAVAVGSGSSVTPPPAVVQVPEGFMTSLGAPSPAKRTPSPHIESTAVSALLAAVGRVSPTSSSTVSSQ